MSVKKVSWDQAISPVNVAVVYHDLRSSDLPTMDISQIVEKIPSEDAQYFYYIGLYFALIGDTLNGLEYYNRALSINPKFFKAYLSKGDLLLKIGSAEEAIPVFNQSLDYCLNDNQKGLVFGKIGYSYYTLSDYPNAIVFFKRALDMDTKNSYWLNNLGCANTQFGDNVEGSKYIRESFGLNSQNPIIQLNHTYITVLQEGIFHLPQLVIRYLVPINDQKKREKLLKNIIDRYSHLETKNKNYQNYIGLGYLLIGNIERSLQFFNDDGFDCTSISNEIKLQVLYTVLEYINHEKGNFTKYNFLKVLTNLCGSEFILKNTTYQDPEDQNIYILTIYAQCLRDPSPQNYKKLAEVFMTLSHETQTILKTDPVFKQSFSNITDLEDEADCELTKILGNISKYERELNDAHKKNASIFDHVIAVYENILSHSPENTRVMKKLADIFMRMVSYRGVSARTRVLEYYESILRIDPNDEEVKKILLSIRYSSSPKDIKQKIGKNHFKTKNGIGKK
jgi:tetratricopeptide (TPR) repeat protein